MLWVCCYRSLRQAIQGPAPSSAFFVRGGGLQPAWQQRRGPGPGARVAGDSVYNTNKSLSFESLSLIQGPQLTLFQQEIKCPAQWCPDMPLHGLWKRISLSLKLTK